MNIILWDDHYRWKFLPLVFTRPVSELRVGIDTIKSKWEAEIKGQYSYLSEDYLLGKYPVNYSDSEEQIYVNSRLVPGIKIIEAIKNLDNDSLLADANSDAIIAVKTNRKLAFDFTDKIEELKWIDFEDDAVFLNNVSDLFSKNAQILKTDFNRISKDRLSQSLPPSNTIIGDSNMIFVEEGAQVMASTLNTSDGPIYIGKEAIIMEGSMVRGPFALCEHSTLKMGAKIYGATTIGPHSKIGGEVNNSIITGYSNKAHDGFLGNSVIGEWCNLGADTNNSNLKNNYAEVRLWDYQEERFVGTGLTFCGLIMGDHSKCAINTQFNTGTVVGVCSNIFGSGFPRNFIPSFSWGGAQKMIEYKLDKTFEVAEIVFERRKMTFDQKEKDILSKVFELTAKYRK